ncbi:hypothetical protein DCAR_0102203 [Daucus carota subsp. sativus]|uniref:Protein TIC 20 n=1 Tax=Daucus carota subsp. sativus TaxID=79200 RepID=A0A162AIA2_DAUCS|nr:PREDICTED: protein TIC 20-II, chloroplastic-like [Daucus carota subsp. sativus]WOG83029.1 hypothetical protein DCAR_0102203 [Daucus carota subsp. sativus]
MFTLDQTECRAITSPLSLSLFLASQVTSFSHLCLHRHRPSPVATRKALLDHPIRSTVHLSSRARFTQTPLRVTHIDRLRKITACSGHSSAPVPDRLISAALYSLTFLSGIRYGNHRIPPTLYPQIYYQYNSNFLIRFVSFFVVLQFVVRNPKLSKYVRINALQTILLDIILQMPVGILQALVLPVWPAGMRIGLDFVFIGVVFGIIYIMVNTILGKTPEFPLLTDTAGIHLRGM